MENTINKIIEIDSIAQKKLDDAQEFKLKLENDTIYEKENLTLLFDEKVKKRITIVENSEKSFYDGQKIIIDQKKINALHELDKIFENNHLEIETVILKNIISI